MYTIGEFSRMTCLTVKTLRFYHEQQVLLPDHIDGVSGYRYYSDDSYMRALGIQQLKELGFSLKEIRDILSQCREERDLTDFITHKMSDVRSEIRRLKKREKELKNFRAGIALSNRSVSGLREEREFILPAMAVVPVAGPYSRIGEGFQTLYRKAGRHLKGQPYAFYYDEEYTPENPTMAAAVELKKDAPLNIDRIEYRKPMASHVVILPYKGPYGFQGRAYGELFRYCRQKGYSVRMPLIEHYIKGPGMLFRGNPEEYITECILLVDSE